jgi:hypothetical protein
MNTVWGIVMALVGAVFIGWGRTRSGFIVYRLLAARSRILWGDNVHLFYQGVGLVLVAVGALTAALA